MQKETRASIHRKETAKEWYFDSYTHLAGTLPHTIDLFSCQERSLTSPSSRTTFSIQLTILFWILGSKQFTLAVT